MTTQPTKPAIQSVTMLASGSAVLASAAYYLTEALNSGLVPPKYVVAVTGVLSAIAFVRRWTEKKPKQIEGIVNQK